MNYKGFDELANAIILQAVDDYRYARGALSRKTKTLQTMLRHTPVQAEKVEKLRADIEKAGQTLREIRVFFRSDWFAILSDVNGPNLLMRLETECCGT